MASLFFSFKLPAPSISTPLFPIPELRRFTIKPPSPILMRCSNTAGNSSVETERASAASGDGLEQPAAVFDAKQAALSVGSNSSNLVAFYADHHRPPPSAATPSLVDKKLLHLNSMYVVTRTGRLHVAIYDVKRRDHYWKATLLWRRFFSPCHRRLPLQQNSVCYIQSLVDGDWNSVDGIQHPHFSWTHELVTRSLASTGGAIAAMHVVMLGLRMAAASLSGHGFLNHVEGYQLIPSGVFDDIAVAISVALQSYPHTCNSERPVLVINLDVHQAKTDHIYRIFEKDSRVLRFNLHGSEASTLWKDMVAPDESSLLDCTGDDYYLAVLSNKLQQLLELHNPSLVFFQAGVDALSEDVSGKLSMTRHGLIHRNNIVYTACYTRRIPLVITMGCGYTNPLQACIQAHADVYRAAALRYGTTHMSL